MTNKKNMKDEALILRKKKDENQPYLHNQSMWLLLCL